MLHLFHHVVKMSFTDETFCLNHPVYDVYREWLGTPIDDLNRMPQCAPPLSYLKALPNHTVAVRVSQLLLHVILCYKGGQSSW